MKSYSTIALLLFSFFSHTSFDQATLIKTAIYCTGGIISLIIIKKTNSYDEVLRPIFLGIGQGLAPVAATFTTQQVNKLFEYPHDKKIEELKEERINLQEKYKTIQGIADKLPNHQQQFASLAQQSLDVEKKITKLEDSKRFSINYDKKAPILP